MSKETSTNQERWVPPSASTFVKLTIAIPPALWEQVINESSTREVTVTQLVCEALDGHFRGE